MIHKKCDVFTPDEISFQMASFLNKDGSIKEEEFKSIEVAKNKV